MKIKGFFLLGVFILLTSITQGQVPFSFEGNKEIITYHTKILIDTTGTFGFKEVVKSFDNGKGEPGKLDFDYCSHPIWIMAEVKNSTMQQNLMMVFENPMLDSVEIFIPEDSGFVTLFNYLGQGYNSRQMGGTFHRFKINIKHNEVKKIYFRVTGTEQKLLPLTITDEHNAGINNNMRDIVYGSFMGVILVMLFYNLFVYASTRDKNYIYYVLYILFIGLGQIAMSGHIYSLFLGNYPQIYKYSIVVLPAFSGLFAILFIKHFLQARLISPGLDKALNFIAVLYSIAALSRLLGYDHISARMMDVIGMPGAAIVYILAVKAYRKGFKSALYFIAAWTIFIVGVVFFVLRNLSVLPFNNLTTYTLPLGAALEVALLSFALADKINTLQAQKREKEKEALQAALENERIIREQNIILEEKVVERTHELAESNNQLSDALHDLKSTQSQLVEQEKMASLGQLTAGIAHEINNPINFVTSNINPLKRDIGMIYDLMDNLEKIALENVDSSEKLSKIKEWKDEIDFDYLMEEMSFLLKGIDEGAHRTAEIVKGLRIFARNDEDTILNTDLIEGIESTLVILNNQFGKIKINRNFSGPVMIDCYPGKLNQVFLNLLSNSIYAINSRFSGEIGGEITISVVLENNMVNISFEDNGIGMSAEVQKKIFEPFFTTKPVGHGTGLGMSIVFKTIETHRGKITLWSEPNVGTRFNIHLQSSLI